MPFDQFEEDIEPFLWRQACVELIVSLLGVLKAAEYPNDSVHGVDFTMSTAIPTTTARTTALTPPSAFSQPVVGDIGWDGWRARRMPAWPRRICEESLGRRSMG